MLAPIRQAGCGVAHGQCNNAKAGALSRVAPVWRLGSASRSIAHGARYPCQMKLYAND